MQISNLTVNEVKSDSERQNVADARFSPEARLTIQNGNFFTLNVTFRFEV